jgi:hypothetical protein
MPTGAMCLGAIETSQKILRSKIKVEAALKGEE